VTVKVPLTAFDPYAELSTFAAANLGAGAVASFVGICRGEGGKVSALTLDHYPGFTEAEIGRLAEAVQERRGLDDLWVVHRAGRIPAGEAIVLVAAASAHRVSAFEAVRELMDYLKTDAPFWKLEEGEARRWVEPTQDDRARREKLEPN
jgi:molybdopterin synthase catalytic subunit